MWGRRLSNCRGAERVWCELFYYYHVHNEVPALAWTHFSASLCSSTYAWFLTHRLLKIIEPKSNHFAYRQFIFFLSSSSMPNKLSKYVQLLRVLLDIIYVEWRIGCRLSPRLFCTKLSAIHLHMHSRGTPHGVVREWKYPAFEFSIGLCRWLAWDSVYETRSLGGVSVVDLLPPITQCLVYSRNEEQRLLSIYTIAIRWKSEKCQIAVRNAHKHTQSHTIHALFSIHAHGVPCVERSNGSDRHCFLLCREKVLPFFVWTRLFCFFPFCPKVKVFEVNDTVRHSAI